MPAVLGVVALAVGGLLALRVARREWRRVNASMDDVRRSTSQELKENTAKLVKDAESGTYRPE